MAAASQETEQHTDESHLKLFGVCVDDSEHSARAFDWYLNSCHKEGNKLAIIHIHIPPPLPAVPMYPGIAVADVEWTRGIEDSIKASRNLLHEYRHKCKALKIPYIIFAETDQGSPGAEIARIAKDNGIKMLIMGTRAHGALKRAFLGSISDYVVHHAHCPVTVVPPADKPTEEHPQ
ncbi:universal stress protein YxiE-like isoform X2 [Rhopilema esculentum]|uniref:universal stress protein YxiE-like isoform X2 n=1 Tax=Rhopilema esculentum TaxID=499914 RepID=UPI0031CF7148